jgi:ribA/ribD-fused uncharacterized protein
MTIGPFKGEYRFLSNFYNCSVLWEGILYPSAEHAYQASKTLDPEIRANIAMMTAEGSKKYGKSLINYRPDWDHIKFEIMKEILRKKFKASFLSRWLIETENEELVEINTWGDTVWGVCNGIGENRLGKILMKIRMEIKTEMGFPIRYGEGSPTSIELNG